MGSEPHLQELSSDDFARRFSLHPGQLMWLHGAGASVSAGIPSAWGMIWQFKQTLFVAQRKASPQSVVDLGNPANRPFRCSCEFEDENGKLKRLLAQGFIERPATSNQAGPLKSIGSNSIELKERLH